MKEIALLRIRDVDPRIKAMSTIELDEKINLIYSLGYVYDPYNHEFHNPFINKNLKAIVTYNLDLDRIENLHNVLQKEFLDLNQHLRKFDEISLSIYGDETKFKIIDQSMFGIYGVIFFLLSIVLYFTGNINFSLGSLVTSFILVNYYFIQNLLVQVNEGELSLSPFWVKFKSFFSILSLLLYPCLYFLLFMVFHSYWLPILIGFSMRYLIKKNVIRNLSKKYWQWNGINDIQDYAEEKGLL